MDLYCPGDEGYGCYKIPTLLKTSKGTLLAMIEARKYSCDDQGDVDLRLRRSVDEGQTWSPSVLMYSDSKTDWTTVGDGNWVEDTTAGKIFLLHTRNNSRLFLSHSDDDGMSWSAAQDVTSTLKYGTGGWVGTGHSGGIQLSAGPIKGRIIIPTYTSKVYTVYSDDHGTTWKMGSPVPAESYHGGASAGEWTIAETGMFGEDGTPILLANVRNSPNIPSGITGKGHRLQSLSRDGGVTWGNAWEALDLPEPIRGCEGSLLYHPPTHQLYFSHPHPSLDLFRTRLQVWTSDNAGATWKEHATVWPSAAGYSSLVSLNDSTLAILYDRNNHTMPIFEAQSVSYRTIAA